MSDIPTSVYNVRGIRNSGWPTGGDAYGHAVLVVVVGVTPHRGGRESRLQGKAGQVNKMNEKSPEAREMLSMMVESIRIRRMSGNNHPDLKLTGEPDAGKLARPVRRGAVGKVLLDSNPPAAYPTLNPLRQF